MSINSRGKLLAKYVLDKEVQLIRKYIVNGPKALKEELKLGEKDWSVIFDYLVVNENLIYKTVVSCSDFFIKQYIEHGMGRVREILETFDSKYDFFMEVAFDHLAIANGGLRDHVLQNRDAYVKALESQGRDFVRKILGLWKDKYVDHWRSVAKLIMTEAVFEKEFGEDELDGGIDSLVSFVNEYRVHRKPIGSNIFVE